jgi:hypothetical protein
METKTLIIAAVALSIISYVAFRFYKSWNAKRKEKLFRELDAYAKEKFGMAYRLERFDVNLITAKRVKRLKGLIDFATREDSKRLKHTYLLAAEDAVQIDASDGSAKEYKGALLAHYVRGVAVSG